MTDIVVFHHVLGLTDGVREFADRLADGGHSVHTPDLYDGRTAATIEEGFEIRTQIGPATVDERAEASIVDLPDEIVYAGISMGVMSAQRFAQTRPGARAALLYAACVPITGEYAFGPWPDDVAVQVHGMDDDEFFAHEGDLDAARDLVATVGPDLAELFAYPGDGHLFVDSSLPSYDADATALVIERSRSLLGRIT